MTTTYTFYELYTFSYIGQKLINEGEDCWRKCNGVDGRCPFCGSEGLCCRIGNKWKRNECDGTIGGSYFHECVARPSKIYCSF